MVTIKEFIKEYSAPVPKKKKRRIRLKNFNPFRKRKYKTLEDEDLKSSREKPEPAETEFHGQGSSLPDDQPRKYAGDSSVKSTDTRKRQRSREFFNFARETLKLSSSKSNNQADDTSNLKGRKRVRKQGSYICLIETTADEDEELPGDVLKTRSGSLSSESSCEDGDSSSDDEGGDENSRTIKKQVVFADDIEVIETTIDDYQPKEKKKKKSKKKKIKKAGVKTVKFIGHGLSNMAMSFQYLSPESAIAPAAKEWSKRQEARYYMEMTMSPSMVYALSG